MPVSSNYTSVYKLQCNFINHDTYLITVGYSLVQLWQFELTYSLVASDSALICYSFVLSHATCSSLLFVLCYDVPLCSIAQSQILLLLWATLVRNYRLLLVLWSTQRLSTFMSTQRIFRHVDIIFNISTKEQWKNKMSIIMWEAALSYATTFK